MHKAAIAIITTTFFGPACLSEQSSQDQPVILDVVGSPAAEHEMPRGVYMVIPPLAESIAPVEVGADRPKVFAPSTAAARWTLYMNRQGGTYTPSGTNDASQNRSTIPTTTSIVPAWGVSDAGWNEVMTCVADLFSRFDIEVTDVEPAPGTLYIESVVAGRPQDLGLPTGVGGVSPFTSDCSTIPSSIVFTFAEVFGTNNRVICEVVAQEVAHSFGLDHQLECKDPMTYLTGCGEKTFQDRGTPCGEDVQRVCACGQQTQNSVQMLLERIGSGDAIAPTVSITSPLDQSTVPPGFSVVVDAADDQAVSRVELYIDGALAQTDTVAPFSFTTDATLSSGTHIIETRAHDSKNVASASIAVNVDSSMDPIDPTDPNPGDPTEPNRSPSEIVGGCSTTRGGGAGTVLLFLIILAGLRRRAHC